MKEIEIPEGYEARIEGNKVIIEPKKSEDERIRKEIKQFILDTIGEISLDDKENAWLDWLEEHKHFWNPTEEDVTLFDKAVTTNTSLTPQDRAKLDIIRMKFKHRPNIEQKEQKPINWTELNWEDINKLEVFINNVHNEYPNGIGQKSFGEEVLEKFREYKGDEDLDEKEQKPAQFKGESLAEIIKGEFEKTLKKERNRL